MNGRSVFCIDMCVTWKSYIMSNLVFCYEQTVAHSLPAPTRVDTPSDYSFLTTGVITGMCTMFEEESKGQSNRELHADFLSLFESAPELTLGPEIGSAIKRRNATDVQVPHAAVSSVVLGSCGAG